MNIDIQKIKEDRVLYDGVGNIYPSVESVKISEEKISNLNCYWLEPENGNFIFL